MRRVLYMRNGKRRGCVCTHRIHAYARAQEQILQIFCLEQTRARSLAYGRRENATRERSTCGRREQHGDPTSTTDADALTPSLRSDAKRHENARRVNRSLYGSGDTERRTGTRRKTTRAAAAGAFVRSRRISSTNATGPSVPPTSGVLYANELCSVVHLSTPGCRNLLDERVDSAATLVFVRNRVSPIYVHTCVYTNVCTRCESRDASSPCIATATPHARDDVTLGRRVAWITRDGRQDPSLPLRDSRPLIIGPSFFFSLSLPSPFR